MSTTKEEQIRAEFESHNGYPVRAGAGYYHEQNNNKWEVWKACAESYEKKLAEKELTVVELIQHELDITEEYKLVKQQLSEANARNAMLVEALIKSWTEVTDDFDATDMRNDAMQLIAANSEAVAAWEADNLDNVALATELWATAQAPTSIIGIEGVVESMLPAIKAYEREVIAEYIAKLRKLPKIGLSERQFGELRAANKGKE